MPADTGPARWLSDRVTRRHEIGGPIVLRYRRVYILPTRQGLFFALVLFSMWLGAINYGNSMAFLLTFLLLGLFMAAMTHAFRNLLGLRLVPLTPQPVFRGEVATFPLRIENHGRRERQDIGAAFRDEILLHDIPGRHDVTVAVTVSAGSRGRLRADRMVVDTRYPGGLFRAWSPIASTVSCRVYPRPEDSAPPPPGLAAGASRGNPGGSGEEDFAGLRRYQRGDPIRRIAWKSTRSREPQVKQFVSGPAQQLHLRWEDTRALGDVERRLSRLCRWVLECEAHDRVYGLELPGARIAPGRGDAHCRRCLAALSDFPA